MRSAYAFGLTSMLLSAGLCHAAPPSSIGDALVRQGRYFDRAHKAVTSGAVTPHATEISVGWGKAAWIGARGVVAEANAEVAGMMHKVGFVRAQGSIGVDFGGGLEGGTATRFGKPGMSAKELFPALEGRGTARLGLGREHARSIDKRVLTRGGSLSWGAGFSAGLSLTLAAVGAPQRKSDTLSEIEQGQGQVKHGLAALARGDETAAATAFVSANALRTKIRTRKIELNKERYQAMKAHE